MKPRDKYEIHTYSYLALRRAVGWVGILLPFVLMLGNTILFGGPFPGQSISLYYHTPMRDVFVGGLCAVALFLFFYAGYDRRDNISGNLAGLFALLVAWFPASETGTGGIVNTIHFISAALFFITLSIFSLFLFTRKDDNPTPEKLKRNVIYVACGVVMLVFLVAMMLWFLFAGSGNSNSVFIFWAETIALIVFGISWLIKGGTLFTDQKKVEAD